MRTVTIARVACMVALAASVSAQEAEAARLAEQERALRARIAEEEAVHTTGSGARCELGLVLVRAGHAEDAVRELEHAIHELGTPTDRALRRRLAACLYNRGRAAEALSDTVGARDAYRRSLVLRPHASVRARLDALPRETSEDVASRVALEACRAAGDDVSECAIDRPANRIADHTSPATVTWFTVATTSVDSAAIPCEGWYAVAVEGETALARGIYQYCHRNRESVQVTARVVILEGGRTALEAHFRTSWEDSDDAPADDQAGWALFWRRGPALGKVSVAIESSEPSYALDVRIGEGGRVEVARASGRVPADVRRLLGQHSVEQLCRLDPECAAPR